MQDATLKELMRLISNGHWNNLAVNEVGIPLRFLQMFGMNLPLWLVTSFVEFELLFLMLLSETCHWWLAHEGYQGLVKTRSLLGFKVWFPKIDASVDQVVKKWFTCQIATPKPSREPMRMTPRLIVLGNLVSIDFCKEAGHYVLVVIYDYSRFPKLRLCIRLLRKQSFLS